MMKHKRAKFTVAFALLTLVLQLTACRSPQPSRVSASSQTQRIVIAPDKHGFIFAESKAPFHPWD